MEKKVRKPRKKRLEVKPVQTLNWKFEIYEIIGNNARFSFVKQFDDLESAEKHLQITTDAKAGFGEDPKKFEIKLVYIC